MGTNSENLDYARIVPELRQCVGYRDLDGVKHSVQLIRKRVSRHEPAFPAARPMAWRVVPYWLSTPSTVFS
jgi:hypothetical protein